MVKNIWTQLLNVNSRNISTNVLRSTRLSLIKRIRDVKRKGGSYDRLGTGVILSIDGVDTTEIERMVRLDARALVDPYDRRYI